MFLNHTQKTQRVLILLWVLAIVGVYTALHFPYRGEEGVYTASSYEMLFSHHFLTTTFMGAPYGRPPLFNWLILSVASVIGFTHMLIASRLVTITATVGSSLVLYWFSREIFEHKNFSLLTVLCFFSGDLLFRRSWIAYADPTFAFLVFSSLACLWVAYRKDRVWLFLPAALALCLAFLTKALTCYVFYGVTALILFLQTRKWRLVFHPVSLFAHLCALAFPIIWILLTPHFQHGHRLFSDITHRLLHSDLTLWSYAKSLLNKTWVYVLRFAPLIFLVLYCLLRRRVQAPTSFNKRDIKLMFWVVLINTVPYWLAPQSWEIRYLLPLFPFIAILFAYVLWHSGTRMQTLSVAVIGVFIAIKLCVSPFGLPWFEHMSYGWTKASQDIAVITKGFPLIGNYDDSMLARLDALRYPGKPVMIQHTPCVKGFAVGQYPKSVGTLLKVYHPGRRNIPLYRCNAS